MAGKRKVKSSANRNSNAETSASRPTARGRRGIKNSSPRDSEENSDSLQVGGEFMTSSSRKPVVKEVAVPALRTRRSNYQFQSPSSASSVYSRQDGSSNDYETPATSAAPTPAELSINIKRRKLDSGSSGKAVLETIGTSKAFQTPVAMKGKRKRQVTLLEDQMNRDELLAKSLQEEEYATEADMPVRSRNCRVPDSEDDLMSMEVSSLSDLDSEMEDPGATTLSKSRSRQKEPVLKCTSYSKKNVTLAAPKSLDSLDDEDHDIIDEEDDDDGEFDSEDSLSSALDDSELDSFDDQIGAAQRASVNNANGSSSSGNRTFSIRARLDRSANRRRSRRRGRRLGMTRAEQEREKLEKSHPEIASLWDDLKAIPIIVPDRVEQPKAITRLLKSFQLEGLDWMRKQEKSKWKGGLLGDEMGMGKTIQAVSLIMSDYPAKDPTLVIVPPVALMQWSSEIATYTDGKLKVLIHHNTDPKVKKLTTKDLKKYDVIMISYSGLESMYRKESKGWKRDDGLVKENSRIHAIHYHRLILDEAHNIKTRTTSVAKACFALKADYKWCLSGTPVQNRIGEFFSLLRFLEVTPFASYFCKACSCAALHWSQDTNKKCTHCSHSGFQHVSVFNQELLSPITQAENPADRQVALGKLRLLTDRIMLRRMKRDNTASMELPPKEVVIHNEFFGEIERDFSSSIMTNTNRQFDTYVSRGVMLNNYANIFGLIMQMRQVANHPDLILKKHAEGGQNILVCSVCDETAEEPIRSKCHHEFCRKCAKDYMRSFQDGGEPDCPRCHLPLAIDFDQPDIEQDEENVKKNSIINRIKMEDWTSSTKIEMLIYDLYKLRSKKQTHKSIVFSQFTSMLQLVEWRLRRAGFNTVMLDGSMSPTQRARSIEYFMKNVDVEVFLVSLKAGGVALNLTEASRVFIVDPWWNPAAEWQSADRCHRIGQKRPCVITRLCIEDSVESRMVLLQEKKANLISSTINNDTVAMEKLTPEDMQFLFRGT